MVQLNCKHKAHNLPSQILIADEANRDDLLHRIGQLPEDAVVIVRDYRHPQRKDWASKIVAYGHQLGIKVLIANDPDLAITLGADGCHFPEYRVKEIRRWKRKYPQWLISTSTHSPISIRRANEQPVSWIIISPILSTKTHPSAHPIGYLRLQKWIRLARHPIIGLGGMRALDLNKIKACGGIGVASIRG